MADDKEPDKKPKEGEIDKNPDLEKDTEGMVDLSDILATGDNQTGAADASEALQQATDGDGDQEVDLFEKKEGEAVGTEAVAGPSKFDKLFAKLCPEGSIQKKTVEAAKEISSTAFELFKELSIDVKAKSIKFAKEDSKIIAANIFGKIKTAAIRIFNEFKQFMSLSWKLKITFVLVLVIGALTVMVAKKSLQGKLVPELKKQYVINFNDVADSIYSVKEGEKWEQFRNPMRFPEYVVRFDRIIVMLKKSKFSSRSPMGVFSIYFETSSQESAKEVKFREPEMRDAAARTLEGVAYDDIRNFEGKKKAKKALIRSLNKVLNQGKIVNVYFKDFVLKP